MIRSKIDSQSTASNRVKVKVDKYEYWFDLLALKVYDENDKEITIKELFELVISTDILLKQEIENRNKAINTLNAKIESMYAEINKVIDDMNYKLNKIIKEDLSVISIADLLGDEK